MRDEDQFLSNNFTWFLGSVKDIADPEKLNRVKVQAYGYYADDIAIADLPFATVMMPNTSASFKGNGSNHELVVGSLVVGFFRDGPSAQDPIILGSIATQTDSVKDIPTEAESNYPNNKVHKTEAGHLLEFDNTSGSERINLQHKNGTTINIAADGTVNISSSNNTVNIIGNTTVTGTIHATGDISTDAGNAPTLATHKHKTTSMDTGTGSNAGKTNDSSIPDA